MVNGLFSVITTAFIITGVGIALRRGAPTAQVISATTGGIAQMQTAAFGPK